MKINLPYLRDILRTYDPEPVELMLSILAMGWGIMLLIPGSDALRQPIWSHLWFSRHGLGLVFLLFSGIRLYGVLGRHPDVRMFAAGYGVVLWTYLTGVLWWGDHFNLGLITLPTFVAFCAWGGWRAWEDQRVLMARAAATLAKQSAITVR